jgi:hypothetical protein
VGKGKRVDVYLEVRKRRKVNIYPFPLPHFASIFFAYL